jgi:large subunit ribosomal protein L6
VYAVPDGVEVKAERNLLTVSGYDRQQVGQVAAEIRDLRRPDVYKLKGIRYVGELLRKKAGKAGAK